MTDNEEYYTPEQASQHAIEYCENCNYSEDHGDSVEYIYCAKNKTRKSVMKKDVCKHFTASLAYE